MRPGTVRRSPAPTASPGGAARASSSAPAYLWCEVADRGGWVRRDEDGVSRFTVRFLLRKGLIWDKGLDLHGPFRGRPPADGAGFGSSSGFPF
jgi:hypothetical protein